MENLTLIIPAKNEKNSLPRVLKEIEDYKLNKLIVISKEDIETYEAIKNLDCEILFQSGKGYGNAIIEGITHMSIDEKMHRLTKLLGYSGMCTPKVEPTGNSMIS